MPTAILLRSQSRALLPSVLINLSSLLEPEAQDDDDDDGGGGGGEQQWAITGLECWQCSHCARLNIALGTLARSLTMCSP